MAIIKNGNTIYEGATLYTYEHYWMDGMLEEITVCWDVEAHKTVRVTTGYYGSDGRDLTGTGKITYDLNETVKEDILATIKEQVIAKYHESVLKAKEEICKGRHVEVVRGGKVPVGTKLEVFWVGEKETYKSRQYYWMHETETIAGCYAENGEKVWIKAEYLKVTDDIKDPAPEEREKAIRAFMEDHARALHIVL